MRVLEKIRWNMQMEDLPEPYYAIAEKYGMEIALGIMDMFQGSQVYFPKMHTVITEHKKERLLEEFNGYNYKELSQKYGYSERWVRKICEEKVAKERNKPLDGQINFEEFVK